MARTVTTTAVRMMAQWAYKDAFLQVGFLNGALEDAEKRRTVGLFESCGPYLVTRKQYDHIVAAQHEKNLAFEFGLGYVVEDRRSQAEPVPQATLHPAILDSRLGSFVRHTRACAR